LFRIFLYLVEETPDLSMKEWRDIISSMTVLLLHESNTMNPDDITSLEPIPLQTRKTLLSKNAKLAVDLAASYPYNEHFHRGFMYEMMVCGLLCLWEWNKMPGSQSEIEDIASYLKKLSTQVVDHETKWNLLHLIMCPMRDISKHSVMKSFEYSPQLEHIKWVLDIGGGDMTSIDRWNNTPLDILKHNVATNEVDKKVGQAILRYCSQ